MNTTDLLIAPLADSDVPALVALARDTWRRHYPSIISEAQIEYMLAQRYDEAAIRAQIGLPDTWWDVMKQDGALAGFAQYERSGADAIKLDKIYVGYDRRGQGLGSLLLQHVESEARAKGARRLYLQVNKNNVSAIGAYRRNGFEVAREVVVDIGGGFVMDDYVMEKALAPLPTGRAAT